MRRMFRVSLTGVIEAGCIVQNGPIGQSQHVALLSQLRVFALWVKKRRMTSVQPMPAVTPLPRPLARGPDKTRNSPETVHYAGMQ